MKFYVYEHWSTDGSRLYYVGKGKNRRAFETRASRNDHHKNAIEKYGLQVRFVFETTDETKAYDEEKRVINLRKREGHKLTNIYEGGVGCPSGSSHPLFGKPISEYHRQRLSKVHTGRIHSKEHRRRVGESKRDNKYFLGRHHTKETKIAMSQAQKGEKGYWYGKKMPETMGQKISKIHKGRPFSDTHRANLVEAWKGRKEQTRSDREALANER